MPPATFVDLVVWATVPGTVAEVTTAVEEWSAGRRGPSPNGLPHTRTPSGPDAVTTSAP
ncbi:hypothetical protein ACFWBC_26035 [Streptomyces sp. NPDC059985]|uniref:hypothetical protein n=1 Tax=Streptomyces sp. NPDC059985 TaxID=3347025 RepID=UPI00369C2FE4